MAITVIPFDEHYLLFTVLFTVAMQYSFFFIAYVCQIDTVTDFAGSTNFLLLAVIVFILNETYHVRQIITTAFMSFWAIRLASYLFYRILKIGVDHRFDEMRASCFWFCGFWTYQIFWVWLVSLPLIFLNSTNANPDLKWSDYLGIILYSIGIFVEAVSDQQKFHFKSKPENKRKFCNVGFWAWSRHPNYFGEILLQWGMFSLCASVFLAASDNGEGDYLYVSIVGPVFLTFLLLFVSGVSMLEARWDKSYGQDPAYREWKTNTSTLITIPTGIYACIPSAIKKTILFDWWPLPPLEGDLNETLVEEGMENSSG